MPNQLPETKRRQLELAKYNYRVLGFKHLRTPYRAIEYSSRIYLTVTGTDIKHEYVINHEKIDGVHIIWHTFLNVAKRIENGDYKPLNPLVSDRLWTNTVFFNDEKIIEDNIGSEIVAVDIDSCYYNTLYNIGAVDEKTCNSAFRKKQQWKHARNIAVGSLNRMGTVVEFDGEKETRSLEKRITAAVRLDVIDTVYNVALKVATELGDDFLFFLTDCFFIKTSALPRCKELLKEYKYSVKKEKTTLMDMLDAENNLSVTWLKSGNPTSSTYTFNKLRHNIYDQKLLETGHYSQRNSYKRPISLNENSNCKSAT